jgi:aryl-alcohol dehydrogenase-like predicted oxidoreductase
VKTRTLGDLTVSAQGLGCMGMSAAVPADAVAGDRYAESMMRLPSI